MRVDLKLAMCSLGSFAECCLFSMESALASTKKLILREVESWSKCYY